MTLLGEWHPFERGSSIGTAGSEGGEILLDEEHDAGARITLEQGQQRPFSITCGIYGTMVHTRYFATEDEAHADFQTMKQGLKAILALLPASDDPTPSFELASRECERFVDRFP
jgi:hypothetical protein